jgi:hypothetical protein
MLRLVTVEENTHGLLRLLAIGDLSKTEHGDKARISTSLKSTQFARLVYARLIFLKNLAEQQFLLAESFAHSP